MRSNKFQNFSTIEPFANETNVGMPASFNTVKEQQQAEEQQNTTTSLLPIKTTKDKKPEDEQMKQRITEIRESQPEADNLFNKRDKALEELNAAKESKQHKEQIRILQKRYDTFNYYVNRLIMD